MYITIKMDESYEDIGNSKFTGFPVLVSVESIIITLSQLDRVRIPQDLPNV